MKIERGQVSLTKHIDNQIEWIEISIFLCSESRTAQKLSSNEPHTYLKYPIQDATNSRFFASLAKRLLSIKLDIITKSPPFCWHDARATFQFALVAKNL